MISAALVSHINHYISSFSSVDVWSLGFLLYIINHVCNYSPTIFYISDLKSALGKKRRDGKTMPLLPLTRMQRVHIGPLVEKYGDDYQVRRVYKSLNLGNSFFCCFPFPFITNILVCRVCSGTPN